MLEKCQVKIGKNEKLSQYALWQHKRCKNEALLFGFYIVLYLLVQAITRILTRLRPGPLLLAEEKGVEGDVGDLDDLESDSGNITDGVTLTTETGDQDLVVLLDEVQATVLGDEGRDLLAVLDQLDTDTLADSGVRLLGLNTDL